MRLILLSSCFILIFPYLNDSFGQNFTEKYTVEKTAIVKDDSITKSYRLHNISLLETNLTSEACYFLQFQDLKKNPSPIDFSGIFEFSCYIESTENLIIELTLFSLGDDNSKISKTVLFNIDKNDGDYSYLLFHVPNMETNKITGITKITNVKMNVYSKNIAAPVSFLIDELTFSYIGKEDMFMASEFAYTKEHMRYIFGEYLEEKRIEGWGHQHKIESTKNRD